MSVAKNHIHQILSEVEFCLSQMLSDREKIEAYLHENFYLNFEAVDEETKRKIVERNKVVESLKIGKLEKPFTIEFINNWELIKNKIQFKDLSTKQRVISLIQQLFQLQEFDIVAVECEAEKLLSRIKLMKLKYNSQNRNNIINIPNKFYYSQIIEGNENIIQEIEDLLTTYIKDFNKKYQALRLSNSKIIPYSVFGDNLKIVKKFYYWLKQYFVSEEIDLFDFLLMFNPNSPDVVKRISLKGGRLADYALLISEFEVLFVSDLIANRGNYHNWWCERFLFNDKEKTKEDISKLLNKLNSQTIQPKFQQEIKELMTELKLIPS